MADKFYSFFNGRRLQTAEGKPVVPVTTIVILSNVKEKELEGHSLITARAAISNRTQRVANLLGVELPEEETLWVDINFWDERAERFKKFMGDREKAKVCLCGSLTAREFTRADETKGVGVSISVDDWQGMYLASDNNAAE